MDFAQFRDIILMQFLGDTMSFSEENMRLLKNNAYSHPQSATAYLEKLKRYFKEMSERTSQKITMEFLREIFPGDFNKDVYLSGKL